MEQLNIVKHQKSRAVLGSSLRIPSCSPAELLHPRTLSINVQELHSRELRNSPQRNTDAAHSHPLNKSPTETAACDSLHAHSSAPQAHATCNSLSPPPPAPPSPSSHPPPSVRTVLPSPHLPNLILHPSLCNHSTAISIHSLSQSLTH